MHAGAVALDDRGLILPGASGSGKTTLVAGLVGSGFHYLSDEAAVIDPATRSVLPFAKSLYVHEGARSALLPAHPELAGAVPYRLQNGDPIWYLPPRRHWLPPAPVPLRLVLMPTFVADAPTSLAPTSRSNVLQCLLEQSFNLRQHQARGIGDLVAILRDVACYTLTFGNLVDAVATVRNLASRD